MSDDELTGFAGTYFNRDMVVRLAALAAPQTPC